MHLRDFEREFEKRARKTGLEYELRLPATEEQLSETEARLRVEFHEQIRRFYLFCDGFLVYSPQMEVLRLDKMDYIRPNLLHFCTVDSRHQLCFDTSFKNERDQWFVVYADTGFRVTYAMANIWSNKVWVWIDWGRRIWETL